MKCIIWDLDNTLWAGVLLEDQDVKLREGVKELIEQLDARGILLSVASRNDEATAIAKLNQFGLGDYFVWPQIGWGSKSAAVKQIAQKINIGLDSIVFIDDQPFERDEVATALPEVRCFDPDECGRLYRILELEKYPVTPESKSRRLLYQADQQRTKAEEGFEGSNEAFLSTLGIVITVRLAQLDDLERAEELTSRTNQLNSTGHPYSQASLAALMQSLCHKVFMISLDDKYGSYGRIGLVLLEIEDTTWRLKLLLTSCRVMSRGVGSIILNYLLREASRAGVRLLADFVDTGRNRAMKIAYGFAGFKEVRREGEVSVLENELGRFGAIPPYVTLDVPASVALPVSRYYTSKVQEELTRAAGNNSDGSQNCL